MAEKAIKTLENNGVHVGSFKQAIKGLLVKGRSKYINIIITGPANCGKTFILQPLSVIFKCFQNPSASAFARVGADEAEIITLSELRWSIKLITWNDFLLLLEGSRFIYQFPSLILRKTSF